MILFEGGRHEGFAPFDLPAKSEGKRPRNQLGFLAPDGSQWSVLIRRAPVVTADSGFGPEQRLWLTLADRHEGRTRRVAGEPLVQQRHELTIDPARLDEEYGAAEAIEDAVVSYWEEVKAVPDQAGRLNDVLAELGLIDLPNEEVQA